MLALILPLPFSGVAGLPPFCIWSINLFIFSRIVVLGMPVLSFALTLGLC